MVESLFSANYNVSVACPSLCVVIKVEVTKDVNVVFSVMLV